MVWFNISNLFKGSKAQVAGPASTTQQTSAAASDSQPAEALAPSPAVLRQELPHERELLPGLIPFLLGSNLTGQGLGFTVNKTVLNGFVELKEGNFPFVDSHSFQVFRSPNTYAYVSLLFADGFPENKDQIRTIVMAARLHATPDDTPIGAALIDALGNGTRREVPIEDDMKAFQTRIKDTVEQCVAHATRIAAAVDRRIVVLGDPPKPRDDSNVAPG